MTSTVDRTLPSSAVQLWRWSRPATTTRLPWPATGPRARSGSLDHHRMERRPGRGCGSRVGDDQQDDHRVQSEAEHGHPVVRVALLGSRIAVQRGQHAQQDRQQGNREADRDQDRAPPSPAFTDGFQRAEDRRGEHKQEQDCDPSPDAPDWARCT